MKNNSVLKAYQTLINDILAGIDSHTNEEVKELGSQLNQFLTSLITTPSQDYYSTWVELAKSAQNSKMMCTLASALNATTYYEVGKLILNNLPTIPAESAHLWLNFFRQPTFLQKIYGQKKWEELVRLLIEKSNFNIHALLTQRLEEYERKSLFNVVHANNIKQVSWKAALSTIHTYKKAVVTQCRAHNKQGAKVAFLMENSLNMALLDLACLSSGVINIMIAANSVPQHITFILNQTKAEIVFVSNDKQLAKIKSIKNKVPHLKTVVILKGSSIEPWVLSFDAFIERGEELPEEILTQYANSIGINNLATIMYTSGTTGDPKGIMFSHLNLIYKRFSRAMALPKIGSEDRYLSYLPLFHTFGRFLEMMGAVFWGAEYAFMENPAMETMLDNMQRIKPTIFISIPKKWYELYNYIASKVDVEQADTEQINAVVQQACGGALKWGLSAAGFLEPDIFRFFQGYGIELMSGFGMTEATGGITMTPPQRYKQNSLGQPLPGIEVKLADDGEMLIRGAYVMIGYYDGDDHVQSDYTNWVPTGDIMRLDSSGFYEIIDRKKEIYKNIKGETIAPQRIENFFKEFELVKQVFLVGDHRQFNTVLIFPDMENPQCKQMDESALQSYFSTVVVAVNNFLASFERIVDFRLINKGFSEAKGELTPKGTYKRRVIEKNYDGIISQMYTQNYITLRWCEQEIRVPNWFLREKGCLKRDISVKNNSVHLAKYNQGLELSDECENLGEIRIGDYVYSNDIAFIDFQIILNNPLYWLGNYEIVKFTGDTIYQWYRLDTTDRRMRFSSIIKPFIVPDDVRERFDKISTGSEYSLEGLHYAVLHFQSEQYEDCEKAIAYFKMVLKKDNLPLYNLVKEIVSRPLLTQNKLARKELFITGLPHFKQTAFKEFLKVYLYADSFILDEVTSKMIIRYAKGDENLGAIYDILKGAIRNFKQERAYSSSCIPSIFNLLAEYGISHPTRYKRIRQHIVRYQLAEEDPQLVAIAQQARIKLLNGFRGWLGNNQPIAVDVETGEEYEWSEVIIFEEDILGEDRDSILAGISETSLIREAIFLLSNGIMVRLYDIPPGGIWVSLVAKTDNAHYYRLSVQTRYQGGFDVMLCLNKNYEPQALRDKINWMIHISTLKNGENLVDNFGGFWADYNMWTKAYNATNSIQKFITRKLRKTTSETEGRLKNLWPFYVWSAAWAHIQFWRRTGYNMELVDKSISNIAIPSHDYQTGIKLISIDKRIKSAGLQALLNDFYQQFVIQGEEECTWFKQGSMWFYIFSALLSSEGEKTGIELINDMAASSEVEGEIVKQAQLYLQIYAQNGYIPKQLWFAIERFGRWSQITSDPAFSAQARTLNELYDSYHLAELEKKYPETRTNFFLHTVFADSSAEFRKMLFNIVQKQHEEHYSQEENLTLISQLQNQFQLSEKEKFFLARLSYPHLKPTDYVEFIKLQSEGVEKSDVVIHLEDYDGEDYLVRRPITPKEISKLHQIFMHAQMPVNFRPEHHFLVAVSGRGHIVGGLFFSYLDKQTVYMEKVVVANRYRRKGISEGLMNEFFQRMHGEHINMLTTGFFRPEYFYRFGFKVERKYSGLVKRLDTLDKPNQPGR